MRRFSVDNNYFFEFHPDYCFVKDRQTRKLLLQGVIDSGLYKIQTAKPKTSPSLTAFLASLDTWHARMGHPATPVVKHLINQFQLPCSLKSSSRQVCSACCQGKMHRLSLSPTHHRSTKPLELIHSDVWGPAPLSSSAGHKYFVIFIDDFSLFT